MSLYLFGWDSAWQAAAQPLLVPGVEPARVCASHRDLCEVRTAHTETMVAISGRVRSSGEWPVTGDWVLVRENAVIEHILPRRTKLSRKQPGRVTEEQVLAANADVTVLVAALDQTHSLRRIERMLFAARACGTRPVIALNKSDLCDDLAAATESVERVSGGAPVIVMSALNGTGVAALGEWIERGETAVLLGASGAGKSTIVNFLRGFACQATQPVRESDSRGRHTTTHRELISLEHGWLLLDAPGVRELQLWGGVDTLDGMFEDVSALAEQCRFRDCSHTGEPGCAVAEGVDPGRLGNYFKMRSELEYLDRRQDARAQLEHKAQNKRLHRLAREIIKHKRS